MPHELLRVLCILGLSLLVAQVSAAEQQHEKKTPVDSATQKFTASAYNLSLEAYALIVDAGGEHGIFLRHGLDPEWVTRPGRAISAADLKELIAQGTQIGMSSPSEILIARIQGLPVKFVAGFVGETLVRVYAKADGPVKTAKDLDGRKIGPTSAAVHRHIAYLSRRLGINAEAMPFTNLDNSISALMEGRIDAIITAEARALALVDRGELRVVMKVADHRPSPELNNALWATEDMIRRDPDLVKRFVNTTLETVRYLKDNPQYAAGLITKRTNMAADVANKVVSQFDWTPSGRPGGDLLMATANYWQVLKQTGAVPANSELKIEDVVDSRFLPRP